MHSRIDLAIVFWLLGSREYIHTFYFRYIEYEILPQLINYENTNICVCTLPTENFYV